MKTELQSRNDNRETFMNSSVVVAAPMPLRRPIGRPLTDRVATARRLTGVAILRIAFGMIPPYRPGTTTDVGAAIIYSLLFGALLLFDAGRYSVDRWIEKRHLSWRSIAWR